MAEVPRLLEQAERTALALADMARGGLRLDDDTLERLAAAQAHAQPLDPLGAVGGRAGAGGDGRVADRAAGVASMKAI